MTDMALDKLRTTDDIDVAGKRVMIRADLNVPVRDGQITDETRITRFLPTVQDLTGRGAKVVIMSHFGRPKGERAPEMTLAPVAAKMQSLMMSTTVRFADDCIGEVAEKAVGEMANGDVLLLENLRYHEGEEKNAPGFAMTLAKLGDIYVNDAFSCAHRAHASTAAITDLMPSYAGASLMLEVNALRSALDNPARPVAAVVGGAKVSTKIPVLTSMVTKVDKLIIGGGMANTFLHAQGINVGKSLCEPDFASTVGEILSAAAESGCKILLPTDALVGSEFKAGAVMGTFDVANVPESGMILDVGPASLAKLNEEISECRTLLWNGPLGAFEIEPFGTGTFGLAQRAAELTTAGQLATIAGGGDTVAALNDANVSDQFTYISTAGGAFLEWLEGRQLPGIVALTNY